MSWFELVQTLIQTIPFPMNIVDEKGTILFQNDVFKDIFGEEGVGKKCWSLYKDDKKQCKGCPLRKGVEIGVSDSYACYGALGGKIYDIHHTGMMFNGKKSMLEIFVDITERKELADEIRRSEEQFRQLFGNMEQGFAVHEMIYDEKGNPFDYRYIMINEAFETLTGLKGVDVVGKTIKESVPDIEQYWINDFGKVAKSGKSEQFENYFKYADKYFNVTAYCPSPDHFAVIFYDVTQYKENEKKIEEKQKFIESILNISPSLTYVYDLIEKKNIYANKGIEELLGYTCAEIECMDEHIIEGLMHPKDYKVYVEKTFPKYRRLKNRTLKHTFRLKHKNGRWVRLLATEVIYKVDDKGKPTQIIGNMVKV